jgi:hydrogenase expression/formation protein HypC
MCLAIPGKIIEIADAAQPENRSAKVSFGGILKNVSLAFAPEAQVDNYVLVHVGFAISIVDEKEAAKVFEYLKEMGETEELQSSDVSS